MPHGGKVGSERAAAKVVQRGSDRFFGSLDDDGFKGDKDAQASRLAKGDETDGGGDQVNCDGLEICGGGGTLGMRWAPATAPIATA